MQYTISQISNRDLVLLPIYRLLRHPGALLSEVLRYDNPDVFELTPESAQYDDSAKAYKFFISESKEAIPFLEFYAESENVLKSIENFTDLEQTDSGLTLLSSRQLTGAVVVRLYWVSSLSDITDLLATIQEELARADAAIQEIPRTGASIQQPAFEFSGYVPDLLNLQQQNGILTYADSLYQLSGPVASQVIINPTSDMLARMLKMFTGVLDIRITSSDNRVIQGLTGGVLKIQSTAKTLILKDCTCAIQIEKSKAQHLLIENCPNVLLSGDATQASRIGILELRNSGITLQGDLEIQDVYLYRQSALIQLAGRVQEIAFIEAGSSYYLNNANAEIENVPYSRIQGLFTAQRKEEGYSDIILAHQSISFKQGQVDFSEPVRKLKVDIEVQYSGTSADWQNRQAVGQTDIMLIYQGMRDSGWTREAGIGALANMRYESGWFSHMIQGNSTYFNGYNRPATEALLTYMNSATSGADLYAKIQATSTNGELVGYGLTQFTSSQNQSALYDQHTATGLGYDKLGVQIPAFKQVLQANQLWDPMNAKLTPGDAAYYICYYYEIPGGDRDAVARARAAYAEELATEYNFQ